MKKRWLKIVSLLTLSIMMAGCGAKAEDANGKTAEGGTVKLKVWVDEESVEQTKEMAKAFEEENSDKTYDIEVIVSDSMKAQENVKNDPEEAADVFMLPHDHLGQLVESGAIYKNSKYAQEMEETMTPAAIEGASYNGEVYGYPYGVETCVLFYNKTMLNEEDLKTFEGLTAKAKLGMNLAESVADYQIAPFFLANSSLLYGENGEDPEGSTFNDGHGLETLKWISNLRENENVVHVKDDMVSSMLEGKIAAAIGGPWNKKDLVDLGENLGVAPYPTADFGSGSKQMYSFQGVKLFAVKASTKAPLEAMALAEYLVNEENQIKRFELTGIIPSNEKAQDTDLVKSDAIGQAVAIMSQSDHSVVMPKIPAVASFWTQCSPLVNDAYAGKIAESDMQKKLDEFVSDISK